jgi:hypothetical protein
MEQRKAADVAELVARHKLAPHPLVERHTSGHLAPASPRGAGFFLSLPGSPGRGFVSRRLSLNEEAAVLALAELAAAVDPAAAGEQRGPVWDASAGVLAAAAGWAPESLLRVLCALRERHPQAVPPLLLRAMGPAAWELTSSLLEQREEELLEEGECSTQGSVQGSVQGSMQGSVQGSPALPAGVSPAPASWPGAPRTAPHPPHACRRPHTAAALSCLQACPMRAPCLAPSTTRCTARCPTATSSWASSFPARSGLLTRRCTESWQTS